MLGQLNLQFIKRSSSSLLKSTKRSYGGPIMDSNEGYIDLRSDTFTKPTKRMREAMANSKVGDDCYGEDPSINELQVQIAKLFGKEAALFAPTGTMSNLICMMIHCRVKGEAAILGDQSHIYNIERGGISALGGIHPIVVSNTKEGSLDLKQLKRAIPPSSYHLAQPRVVALENTHNLAGGMVIDLKEISKVNSIARKHNIKMHLDGARALNAASYLNIDPADLVADFDTVNFCLSKGLGCPIGSLVIGTKEDIAHAVVIRKMLGGAMRQVGVLGICGLDALQDWKEIMKTDNENGQYLAQQISSLPWISINAESVKTNIIIFRVKKHSQFGDSAKAFSDHMRFNEKILMSPSFIDHDKIRMVTHRDITQQDLEKVIKAFKSVK
ncbi:threonine aldolase [Stylonychia lemnae]|uniref:Threonine aldolase n=1 Tax=Stylonychia lemnae TaxID=5949 RepID=A0A078AI56_STYLE|nr:threonine aldolase [Stylonychia lemnae]|eukprot:CDW81197.1 threonine aldolase [Stylonychia lemnae]